MYLILNCFVWIILIEIEFNFYVCLQTTCLIFVDHRLRNADTDSLYDSLGGGSTCHKPLPTQENKKHRINGNIHASIGILISDPSVLSGRKHFMP
jgi:hypothetical protein